jgi:serine/threonine protein kinase
MFVSPPSPPPDRRQAAPKPDAPYAETLVPLTRPEDMDTPTAAFTPIVESPPTLVGKTFGDYELLAEIGRGGMGVVFKARQLSLDRIVALKMLLSEHLRDAVRLARFLTEARTIAGLDHPNIVSIFQVGHCDFGHFFAMEYVDGKTLEEIVREKKLVSVSWAVSLMCMVAEAIQHAHSKGVVHRDLKPANIMIDRFRRPVVMDFGIAKFLGQSSSLTQEGTIMGTPAFMAPEQAGEDFGEVGPHSDVYALGAILYMLLTGKPPYEGPTPLSTVLKVIEPTPPLPVRGFRAEVPGELERLCLKCLAKRPEDRPHSAKALVDELRRFRSSSATRKVPRPAGLLQVILEVAETGKKVRLYKPITLVGRATECTMLVRASDVSKHHCQILLDTERVMVEDLGSANGTFVNGKPVRKARLRDGDELRIADHLFKVRIVQPED